MLVRGKSTCTLELTSLRWSIFFSPDEGALIFLSLLCSSMRNTAFPSSKMHALDMLLLIGRHVADDIKLDRLVPYIVSCLHDEVGIVRAHALKTLAKVVCSKEQKEEELPFLTSVRPCSNTSLSLNCSHVAGRGRIDRCDQCHHFPGIYPTCPSILPLGQRGTSSISLCWMYCTVCSNGSSIPGTSSGTITGVEQEWRLCNTFNEPETDLTLVILLVVKKRRGFYWERRRWCRRLPIWGMEWNNFFYRNITIWSLSTKKAVCFCP